MIHGMQSWRYRKNGQSRRRPAFFSIAKSLEAHWPFFRLCGFVLTLSLPSPAMAEEGQWPRLKQGMWQFVRTIENGARRSLLPWKAMVKQDVTRCVDPNVSMKGVFNSGDIGNCHSAKPQFVDNKVVFPLRCDFMGPVRTEIEVGSDAAYVEVNELTMEEYSRKETVVARRVGDCDPPELTSSASRGYQASSVDRRPLNPTGAR
jgi:hypothetical protein